VAKEQPHGCLAGVVGHRQVEQEAAQLDDHPADHPSWVWLQMKASADSRFRNHRPEVPREGAGATFSQRPGNGGRAAPLPGVPPDPHSARRPGRAPLALVPPQPVVATLSAAVMVLITLISDHGSRVTSVR
jgi:hypothetical protein